MVITEMDNIEIRRVNKSFLKDEKIGTLIYSKIGHYFQIDAFCVAKDYRCQGNGRAMIEQLKTLAQDDADIQWIQVYPKSEDQLTDELISNSELNMVYEKYGFNDKASDFDYDKPNQLMKMHIDRK